MRLTRRQFAQMLTVAGGSIATGLLFGCSRPAPAPNAPSPEPKPDAQPTPTPAPTPMPLATLALTAPAAPPSILLAQLAGQERMKGLANEVTFAPFKNLDQLRADMVGNRVQVAAVPTYVAANLYRRGLPVQLLNVTVWGHLHLLTTDESIQGWEDLKGKTVYIPFKGDSPDLIFRIIANQAGIKEGEIQLEYTAAAPEAMQMLLAGKASAVVLPEPVVTAAMIQGQQKGIAIREVFELRKEWGRVTGREPFIPQIGTMAISSLIQEHPEVIAAIQEGLPQAITWTEQNPAEAAALGEQHLGDLKAPVIQRSLGRTPFKFVTAAAAREELEFFFTKLMELSPEIVGGGLPDEAFYYKG